MEFNLSNLNGKYRIHSNKRPGRLDKSFWVGDYLFQQTRIDQKIYDFGHFHDNS